MKFPALLLLLMLAAPCKGWAQQTGQSEVVLRFLSFPRSQNPDPIQLLLGEGRTVEVPLPTNELSREVRVPRMATWQVGEMGESADGEPVFQVYGRAQALDSPSQLLLLVKRGANYSHGFNVLVLDNRTAGFGRGQFLFMNAATTDIAGEVGGERFALRPGTHSIIRPRAEDGGSTFPAVFYYRGQEAVRPFFSSQWPTSDVARGLIFFYNDPDSGHIRLHSIRDFGLSD